MLEGVGIQLHRERDWPRSGLAGAKLRLDQYDKRTGQTNVDHTLMARIRIRIREPFQAFMGSFVRARHLGDGSISLIRTLGSMAHWLPWTRYLFGAEFEEDGKEDQNEDDG